MRKRQIALLVALLPAVLAIGCARQPGTRGTSAPSPGGAPAPVAGDGSSGGSTDGAAGGPATLAPAGKSGGDAGSADTAGGGASSSRVEVPNPANAPPRPDPRQFVATAKLRDIYFDFDSHAIRPGDGRILDGNVDWIQSNPTYLILIEGHADERGTNQYNIALGESRARAALNYLVAHGVRAERITTLSYGEERPFCIERTDECWEQNRRAHFLVRGPKPPQ